MPLWFTTNDGIQSTVPLFLTLGWNIASSILPLYEAGGKMNYWKENGQIDKQLQKGRSRLKKMWRVKAKARVGPTCIGGTENSNPQGGWMAPSTQF